MTNTQPFINSRSRTVDVTSRRRSLLWGLALTCLSTTAEAQQYKSDPVDDVAGRNSAIAQQCVKYPAVYAEAANKAKFTDYFTKFYFPDMTGAEDKDLGHLGEARYRLFKYYLWATSNEELQRDLTNMAYDYMKNVVQDASYHPAVRYNAILVIGMLDEQYSDGRRPPKPLQKATRPLTAVVDMATTGNRFSPPVILGALIGLERHAQFHASLPPDAVTAMTAALVKLVTHDEPIQEMDRDAYAWMRIRAASALSKLGTVGEKNVVHNALITLMTKNKSLDDRCEVAGLLEKINYKDAKLDDAGTAQPLFALARDVAAAEDKHAQDFQDQGSSGGGGQPFPGIGPGGASGDQDTYPRREILARLSGLRAGLASVKQALPTDTQKTVDELLKAIDSGKAAAASKETVELKVAEAIRTMAAEINKAVPPAEKAGAAKPADTF